MKDINRVLFVNGAHSVYFFLTSIYIFFSGSFALCFFLFIYVCDFSGATSFSLYFAANGRIFSIHDKSDTESISGTLA